MSSVSKTLRCLSVERMVAWVALLPVPVWFGLSALLAEPAAWRAQYRASAGEALATVVFERQLSHLWSGKYFKDVPTGTTETFVAEFDACLTQAHDVTVPVMLVADGRASFTLDGVLQLATQGASSDREVKGVQLLLRAGRHHLHVDFHARPRPSVGLLASFDGEVPIAIASGELVAGTTVSRPRPGADPCGD